MSRLKQLGREAKDNSASIILVAASVLSAVAAVSGITSWVAVIAAVAALLSGSQVLWSQLFVPLRIRSAEHATQLVVSQRAGGQLTRGTAFQIATNRWLTAQHVVRDSTEIRLKVGREIAPARIVYEDEDRDVAILSSDVEWQWSSKTTDDLPDSGDRVQLVGWAVPPRQSAIRLIFDFRVQGPAENNLIALTGPNHPQLGFSGAPAIDMRSGRVVGFLSQYIGGKSLNNDEFLPEPVPLAFIVSLSDIPAEFRSRGPTTRP
jgi:hypothetical protein